MKTIFLLQFTPDTPFLGQVNCDNNRWFRGKGGRRAKKLEYRMLQITEVIKLKYYDMLVLVFFKKSPANTMVSFTRD